MYGHVKMVVSLILATFQYYSGWVDLAGSTVIHYMTYTVVSGVNAGILN